MDSRIEQHITSFFPRLMRIGGLLHALVGHRRLRAVIEVRGADTRVLLDLAAEPFDVEVGGPGIDGDASLAGSPEDLYATFTGNLGIMEGIAQRRLLLSGGMGDLVLLFPVVEQIPAMFADHLESRQDPGEGPGRLRRALGRIVTGLAAGFSFVAGRLMRGRGRKDVIAAVSAMSRGALRFSLTAKAKSPAKEGRTDYSNRLAAPRPSPWVRAWVTLIAFKLYWAGWTVSVLKHRLGIPVDVFRLMESFSNGVRRVTTTPPE